MSHHHWVRTCCLHQWRQWSHSLAALCHHGWRCPARGAIPAGAQASPAAVTCGSSACPACPATRAAAALWPCSARWSPAWSSGTEGSRQNWLSAGPRTAGRFPEGERKTQETAKKTSLVCFAQEDQVVHRPGKQAERIWENASTRVHIRELTNQLCWIHSFWKNPELHFYFSNICNACQSFQCKQLSLLKCAPHSLCHCLGTAFRVQPVPTGDLTLSPVAGSSHDNAGAPQDTGKART